MKIAEQNFDVWPVTNQSAAFPGAENAMETGTDLGHEIPSAVPSELMQFRIFPRS